MIKIDETNRDDVISVYASRLLDDMDFDTLYSFAYERLVDDKSGLNITGLLNEIMNYYPEILENDIPLTNTPLGEQQSL